MKKEFKAIAMLCNKEQFVRIKPKLKSLQACMIDFTYSRPYLVNNLGGVLNQISTVNQYDKSGYSREIHEEWNDKIFLSACGIEVEETFTITKEQILELKNGYKTEKLKEWFPEAFEEEKIELIVGKWYNYNGAIINYQGKKDSKEPIIRAYGIVPCNGGWKEESNFGSSPEEWIEATELEIFEALKHECVKREILEGSYALFGEGKYLREITNGDFRYSAEFNSLLIGNDIVFDNGVWAELAETMTKSAAEQKLNCKII